MSSDPELESTLTPSLAHAGSAALTVSGERLVGQVALPPPPEVETTPPGAKVVGVGLDVAIRVGHRQRERVDMVRSNRRWSTGS